jgi:hypothetical protein
LSLFLTDKIGATEALWVSTSININRSEGNGSLQLLADTLGAPVIFEALGGDESDSSCIEIFRPYLNVSTDVSSLIACVICQKQSALTPLFLCCRRNTVGTPHCGRYCWNCLRESCLFYVPDRSMKSMCVCLGCYGPLPVWAINVCLPDGLTARRLEMDVEGLLKSRYEEDWARKSMPQNGHKCPISACQSILASEGTPCPDCHEGFHSGRRPQFWPLLMVYRYIGLYEGDGHFSSDSKYRRFRI